MFNFHSNRLDANESKITFLAYVRLAKMEKITPIFGKGAGKQESLHVGTIKEKKIQRSVQRLTNKPIPLIVKNDGGIVKYLMAQHSY